MLSHDLSAAWRHFRRHRATTLINIACLIFGLVAFVLAWCCAEYFGNADRYHEKAARTLIMTRHQPLARITFHLTPWQVADRLRTDFDSIEAVARVSYPQELGLSVGGTSVFTNSVYADREFLSIFDLTFTAGDRRHALDEPNSVVLSEAMAVTLFNSTQVLGRTVRIGERQATVRGVVGQVLKPSHLSTSASPGNGLNLGFEAIFSIDMGPWQTSNPQWDQDAFFTYVVLRQHASMSSFSDALPAFTQRHVPTALRSEMEFRARPVSEFRSIGLDALVRSDATGISSSSILKTLGLLVLVIACLNYTNLATALALTRTKEVALRKVVGASRFQVIRQHLTEGIALTSIALLCALLFAALLAYSIGSDALAASVALFGTMPAFWGVLLLTVVGVGILASAYPAFALSRVRPAQALRSSKGAGRAKSLTSLLVTTQFAASSFLAIAAFVMIDQHREMRSAVFRTADDPLVTIVSGLGAAGIDGEVFKQELLRQPAIRGVTSMHRQPWTMGSDSDSLGVSDASGARPSFFHQLIVGLDFFTTLDIRVVAGRTFSHDRASDIADIKAWTQRLPTEREFNIVVEESMLARLGIPNAAAAVDTVLYRPISNDGSRPAHRVRIIGVVGSKVIMPLNGGNPGFYLLNSRAAVVPIIRVAREDVATGVANIDNVWRQLSPNSPIKRRFAEEQFDLGFELFAALNNAFTALALFASLIAIMGLVGMAVHVTQRRMHEIGVRKALGARASQVFIMLLRSFSIPVVVANLLVWPVVYVVMSGYLGIFANRGALSAAPFIVTLLGSIAVAWLAVTAQAARAARLQPSKVLRYE